MYKVFVRLKLSLYRHISNLNKSAPTLLPSPHLIYPRHKTSGRETSAIWTFSGLYIRRYLGPCWRWHASAGRPRVSPSRPRPRASRHHRWTSSCCHTSLSCHKTSQSLHKFKCTRNLWLFLMPEFINGGKKGRTSSECDSLGFCVDELLFVSPERFSMALKDFCFYINSKSSCYLDLKRVTLSIILIGDSLHGPDGRNSGFKALTPCNGWILK